MRIGKERKRRNEQTRQTEKEKRDLLPKVRVRPHLKDAGTYPFRKNIRRQTRSKGGSIIRVSERDPKQREETVLTLQEGKVRRTRRTRVAV